MKVTMLLADSVQVADGKLFVLGGSGTSTGPGPFTHGVALIVHVPWNDANRKLAISLELVTADGQPVTQPGPLSEQPIRVDGDFEVGRPVGVAAGSTIDVPLAINLPMLQLVPDTRYLWRLRSNNSGRPRQRVAVLYQARARRRAGASRCWSPGCTWPHALMTRAAPYVTGSSTSRRRWRVRPAAGEPAGSAASVARGQASGPPPGRDVTALAPHLVLVPAVPRLGVAVRVSRLMGRRGERFHSPRRWSSSVPGGATARLLRPRRGRVGPTAPRLQGVAV